MIVYLSREGKIVHLVGAFPLPESPDSTEDFHVAIHPGDPVTFGRSYDQWAGIKQGPVSIELPEVPEEEPAPLPEPPIAEHPEDRFTWGPGDVVIERR